MKRKLLLAALCVVSAWGGVNSAFAQKDVTSKYITNATLSNGTTGWTVSNFNAPQSGNGKSSNSFKVGNDNAQSHNTEDFASEAYAGWSNLDIKSYSLTQKITLPAGHYTLVNYSFFRYDGAANTDASKSLAFLKAGDNQVAIKTLGSIAASGYADSQCEGAAAFDSKMYRNTLDITIDADNTEIEIGIVGTFDQMKSWCIVGKFELIDTDQKATMDSPFDVTGYITNPGFEYRNLTGWTQSPANYLGAQSNDQSFKTGFTYAEKWQKSGALSAGSISQTISALPAGLYRLTANLGGDGTYIDLNGQKANWTADGNYTVNYTLKENEDLVITAGKTAEGTANWIHFDNFKLLFCGDPLVAYKDMLNAAVTNAQAYIDSNPVLSTAHIAALQAVVNDNDNDDNAFTEESQFNTAIENIETAVETYKAMVAPYAAFNALKSKASAIADVAYTETTSGSHSTFTTAISTQATAADNATTVAGINTAIDALKTAIKTYIAGAEPKNEGEFFDITCLIANPDFDDNNITGWTKESTLNPNTRIQCNEFYGKAAFDFYQVVDGLPNGSYTLSMKAFQRPGGYDDVYKDYAAGTNNATAKVYVNSDESNVMNIMEEMNATRIYTDPNGVDAFNSDKQPKDASGFIPNSMEGAAAWFAAGKYQKTVAALVESGTLRLGFKDDAHSGDVWTLFDEFRLRYYGSSKLVYYQQYLPQLKAEVSADLGNGTYANVLVSSEDEALDAALAATPASETEEAYQTVIDNLKAAQTAFRAAAASYDALVAAKDAALTKVSANIGTGVFQYNETTNNTLFSAYETAKGKVDAYTFTTSSTAADVQALVDALDGAIDAYNNQALNAPAADKRYVLTIVEEGKDWNGNAVTFIAGARTAESSGGEMGGYGIKYLTPADAKYAQALKFTAVDGEVNTYKVSAVRPDGNEQYLTTGSTYGGNNDQIRTTDDASKACWVKINPTSTNAQFQLFNVSANKVIANSNNDDMYTNGSANFIIAEAAQASVNVSIAAGVKWGTRIFPFTPVLPSGVKAYACSAVDGSTLTLEEVATPAANTPYILYAEEGLESTDLTGWGVLGSADAKTVGYLTGVYAATAAPNESYVLQNNDGKVGFYKVDTSVATPTVGANRAYLTVPSDEEANVRAFFFGGDEATAISGVEATETGDGALYNVAGQRVQKGYKGIVIKNGKKYLSK